MLKCNECKHFDSCPFVEMELIQGKGCALSTPKDLLTPLDEKIVERMGEVIKEQLNDCRINGCIDTLDLNSPICRKCFSESLLREIAPSIKESGRREDRVKIKIELEKLWEIHFPNKGDLKKEIKWIRYWQTLR